MFESLQQHRLARLFAAVPANIADNYSSLRTIRVALPMPTRAYRRRYVDCHWQIMSFLSRPPLTLIAFALALVQRQGRCGVCPSAPSSARPSPVRDPCHSPLAQTAELTPPTPVAYLRITDVQDQRFLRRASRTSERRINTLARNNNISIA